MDDFLKQQEASLLKKSKEIKEQIDGFSCNPGSEKDKDHKVCFPDYGKEEQDNAEEVDEYQTKVILEGQLENDLGRVELALKKIKEKIGYGICEKCKQPINRERLAIKPEARYCVNCAQ
jgi:DnaK suppressor protein